MHTPCTGNACDAGCEPRNDFASGGTVVNTLQGKDEAQTGVDVTEQRAADAAGALSEKVSVDRDDLGDIRDRVPG